MTSEDNPAIEDTIWFPLFISEFLVISTINVITITAFARIRHLRKHSTYLIINLTVADLLVGVVTGPLSVFRNEKDTFSFKWPVFIKYIFPVASPMNLCLISLERLHARLYPFRHCLITKWLYFKIIIGSWFTNFLVASAMASLELVEFSYLWASFGILVLLVLTVSYVIIILNVQRSPHLQNRGLIHSEMKLSVTLFMVAGVSVLTILPWAIYYCLPVDLQRELSRKLSVEIHGVLAVIYFANSFVNPLVYAIRMQEFRKAIVNLVLRQHQADNRFHRNRAEQNRFLPLQLDAVL